MLLRFLTVKKSVLRQSQSTTITQYIQYLVANIIITSYVYNNSVCISHVSIYDITTIIINNQSTITGNGDQLQLFL